MRSIHGCLLLGALLTAPSSAPATEEAEANQAVLRLHVVGDDTETDGTCALIHHETSGADDVLYCLTSSRLFGRPDDESPPRTLTVRVRVGGTRVVDVQHEDMFIVGSPVDVAILRVRTSATATPLPVVYDTPSAGDVFLISGRDESDAPATVAERIQFKSTLLAVGDRDASALAGCVGAPAISQSGVFGVVTECGAGRSPVITLLSMARPFIERHVPKAMTPTATTPQFDVVDRQIAGPLLLVGCNATKTEEVDVPLRLASREWAVDATAALVNPRQLLLGDVTVLKLEDRSVRLRFSIGGVRSAPSPSAPCPQGQALVTVHVNVAVARPPG